MGRVIKPERMNKKPEGSYRIIGAIGKGVGEKTGEYEDVSYYEAPKSHIFYKLQGYQRLKGDDYVEVYTSRKGKVILSILLVISLLCLSSLGIWSLMNPGKNLLDPKAQEYVPKIDIPKNSDPSKIAIPGYDSLRMPEGKISHFSLWNPETNPCYFKFVIKLDETGEQLYESKLVEPGKAVVEQEFSKKLTAGRYAVTIVIKSYNLEDPEREMNGGEVQTTLLVVKPEG